MGSMINLHFMAKKIIPIMGTESVLSSPYPVTLLSSLQITLKCCCAFVLTVY
jgi:hypothetical protein